MKKTKPNNDKVAKLRERYIRLYTIEGNAGDVARLRIALIELVGEAEQARLIRRWNKEAQRV